VLTDYLVMTVTDAAPSVDEGDPQQIRTVHAPDGMVILSASGYYYPNYDNAPTDLAQAYDTKPVFLSISSDGTSVDILSAPIMSAQYPSSAVVQLVCAREVTS
jgi:hypothetical protein